MYHGILTDLAFFMIAACSILLVIFTFSYWFIRVVIAAVGYEARRVKHGLDKWANS